MAKHQIEAKKVNDMSAETMTARLQKMLLKRAAILEEVDNYHVKLQKGNSKTGSNCYTVSLIPIVDCANCAACKKKCYDIRNDCWRPTVQDDRAKNSAIHKAARERYWAEIDTQVKANYVTELRINVGGDLDDEDFPYVAKLGEENPRTMILFFTKNYSGINRFLSRGNFPGNVKPIMSAWPGMELDNPFNLPCSHILWADGSTTAPEYGAYYCGGNCSECAFKGEGCWTLKRGEHVIFKAH